MKELVNPNLDPTMEQQINNWRRQWVNLGEVAHENRRKLIEANIPIIERLASGPIPIRIRLPFSISPDMEGIVAFNLPPEFRFKSELEKESMWTWYVYGDKTTGQEHIALIKDLKDGKDLPVRVHSSCITAETFHAANCDCEEQLNQAKAIAEMEGKGGIIWLNQEGRGNGTVAKVNQLTLMVEKGINTVEAYQRLGYPSDQRDYQVAAEILADLGIQSIRLITNSPDKLAQMQKYGIDVEGQIPCEIPPLNDMVRRDLNAKQIHHGHTFQNLDEE